jgi:hypothetical protein
MAMTLLLIILIICRYNTRSVRKPLFRGHVLINEELFRPVYKYPHQLGSGGLHNGAESAIAQ